MSPQWHQLCHLVRHPSETLRESVQQLRLQLQLLLKEVFGKLGGLLDGTPTALLLLQLWLLLLLMCLSHLGHHCCCLRLLCCWLLEASSHPERL
jgi:hypothetical protein